MIDEYEELWESEDSLNGLEEKVNLMKQELRDSPKFLLNLSLSHHNRSLSTETPKKRSKKKSENLVLPKINEHKRQSMDQNAHKDQYQLAPDHIQNSQSFVDSLVLKRTQLKKVAGQYVPPQKHMVLGLTVRKPRSKVRTQCRPIRHPDWAYSVLNSYAISGHVKFNSRKDPSVFTFEQFKKVIQSFPKYKLPPSLVKKAVKTIERLKEELLIGNYVQHTGTTKSIFTACSQLFDIRKITMDILVAIQQRENACNSHSQLVMASLKILSLISNWKDLNIPFEKFVYKGVDQSLKMQDCIDTGF